MSVGTSSESDDLADAVAAVQEGDYDAVKDMLAARVINPNSFDRGRCTLLHWAAINNRIRIANLLIDYGAESFPGGYLNETPLQWAIRKRYYCMAQLLVDKLHPTLGHRSHDGLDALHLACRLDDINALFLLLSWGAGADSLDNDGNTALLWLLKGNEVSPNVVEAIRLLLRFGANPLATDLDGNCAMHLMAYHRQLDLSLAFLLYQSAGSAVAHMTNRAGHTPYGASAQAENRRLSRFLFDMLLFNYFPYWLPGALCACLFPVGFVLLQYDWYFYGGLYFAAFYALLSWTILQQFVYDHHTRCTVGAFAGLVVSFVAVFHVYLAGFISALMQLLLITLFLASCLLAYHFITTKPRVAESASNSDLCRKIVHSSPSEGTDEENDLQPSPEAGESSASKKITKDAFTGRIQVVAAAAEGSGTGGRKRGLGPRICGCCLADKRAVCTTASGLSTISIATHCLHCRCCVLDADHHNPILGNCVGRGNRRCFVAFLTVASLCSLLFLGCLKHVQYDIFCDTDLPRAGFLSTVYNREVCLFWTYPALWLAQVLSFGIGCMFLCLGYNELMFVSRETTLTNVLKLRYVARPPPSSRQLENLVAFLRTGEYRVTYPRPEDDMGQRRAQRERAQAKERHSRHQHDHGHSHEHGHCHEGKNSAEGEVMDESVRSLLARIETDMGMGSPAAMTVLESDAARSRSHTIRTAPSGTPSRRPSAASDVGSRPSANSASVMNREYDMDVERGQRSDELDESGNGDGDDGDDEFDAEFISSSVNEYQNYYWSENYAHDSHQSGVEDESTQLLRSR